MFIREDENILLMDTPTIEGRWMSIDELRQLRDAGIQTAYLMGSSMDDPDSVYDRYLERVTSAGLKAIIPLWSRQQIDLPDAWYVKTKAGIQRGVLSPWNGEAMAYYNSRLMSMARQFNGPDCMIISSWLTEGETILLNEAAYYDDAAVRDYEAVYGRLPPAYYWNEDKLDPWLSATYTRLLCDQQAALGNGEVWFMAHRQIATYNELVCNGCKYIDAYLDAWRGKPVNHISYTYFGHGPNYWAMVERDRVKWGVKEWAGAEYAEGLRAGHARIAVDNHLRGLFIGPLHPFTGHKALEPWMVDEIRKAHQLFEDNRLTR